MTLQLPGARQWWGAFHQQSGTEANSWFGDEFRDYVDGLIREGEAAE
jgi:hypothetical protein